MPQTTIHLFRTAANQQSLFSQWLEKIAEIEPRAHVKCLQRVHLLSCLGNELRRPLADSLRDGIYELRIEVGTVNYRILYFFCGPNTACLSHGLTKKGKVPDHEIDLAIERKALVKKHPDRHLAEVILED